MFRVAEVPPRPPYVAVVAKTVDDVERIGEMRQLIGPNRAIAVAIHINGRELDGLGNQWPGLFNSAAELAGMVEQAHAVGLEAHVHLSKVPPNRLRWVLLNLDEATMTGSLDGIQVNNYLPADGEPLGWWRDFVPGSRKICALDPDLVNQARDGDPMAAVSHLMRNYGHATDGLYDQSEGRGQLTDAELAFVVLRRLRQHWPSLRLGVAGGLGPGTMGPVERLAENGLWPLNTCATTRLLTDGALDLGKVRDYLTKVGEIDAAFGV